MKSEVNAVSRQRVSITLPKECIDFLDKKIESRTYANRSHAIEVLIIDAMRKETKQ